MNHSPEAQSLYQVLQTTTQHLEEQEAVLADMRVVKLALARVTSTNVYEPSIRARLGTSLSLSRCVYLSLSLSL